MCCSCFARLWSSSIVLSLRDIVISMRRRATSRYPFLCHLDIPSIFFGSAAIWQLILLQCTWSDLTICSGVTEAVACSHEAQVHNMEMYKDTNRLACRLNIVIITAVHDLLLQCYDSISVDRECSSTDHSTLMPFDSCPAGLRVLDATRSPLGLKARVQNLSS